MGCSVSINDDDDSNVKYNRNANYQCTLKHYCSGCSKLMFIHVNLYTYPNNMVVYEQYLNSNPQELDLQNELGLTPVMMATLRTSVDQRELRILQILLEKKPNLELQTKFIAGESRTALMYAAEFSNTLSSMEAVSMLLNAGADVNQQNNNGDTALMLAVKAMTRKSDVIDKLPNRKYRTDSKSEVLPLLVSQDAKVDIVNYSGHTALSWLVSEISKAQEAEHLIKAARILLEAGANPNHVLINGESILILSAEHCHTENGLAVMQLLLQNRANPNLQNYRGQTALMRAIQYNYYNDNLEAIQELLAHKANANIWDQRGWLPLTMAISNFDEVKSQSRRSSMSDVGDLTSGNIQLVRLLLQHTSLNDIFGQQVVALARANIDTLPETYRTELHGLLNEALKT